MSTLMVSVQLGLEPMSALYSTTTTFSGGSAAADVSPLSWEEKGGLVPKHEFLLIPQVFL